MKLHLGVIDIPYQEPDPAPRKAAKPRKGGKPSKAKASKGTRSPTATTTGDVAEILEAKYGVMEFFADRHMPEIADELTEALKGQLENVLMGAPHSELNLAEGTDKIATLFRQFIDDGEMNGQPGVPTKAALDGKSKRFKRNRGPVRPSFVDTGLYEANFAAWVEP